jgi:hypothetical protein
MPRFYLKEYPPNLSNKDGKGGYFMSTWVEKYVKKLRGRHYPEIDVFKVFEALVPEFNQQLEAYDYNSRADYNHSTKQIYFPDCTVAYRIQDRYLFLEKMKTDGSEKINEVAIYDELDGYSIIHLESSEEVAHGDTLSDAIEEAIIYLLLNK